MILLYHRDETFRRCNKRNHFNPSEENIYSDIQQFCNQRTLAKWRLRREMRKVMSREQYKKYGGELESAILNVGNHISLSETNALLEAAND